MASSTAVNHTRASQLTSIGKFTAGTCILIFSSGAVEVESANSEDLMTRRYGSPNVPMISLAHQTDTEGGIAPV